MPEFPVKKAPVLTDKQIDKMLQQIADGFAKQLRSPVMHTPSEVGLEFEEVTFPRSTEPHSMAGSSGPPVPIKS